jgi:uncharacterized membrane protein YkvA (DUF1232 family)
VALPSFLVRARRRARRMKRQLWALYLAWKDPATPMLARVVIACAVAYAASPIDLIPDFIPVLGQLDDLLVLFLGLGIVLWLTPRHVIEDLLGELE